MSPGGAALFDVDGTLVDTTYLHTVAWWEALRQAGHRVAMARIHRAVGMSADRLLEHLLKLAYVPMAEPRHGWKRTVREQRDAIERTLDESPSLRRLPEEALAKAYAKARRDVLAEYRLPDMPQTCPFDLEREVLAEEWFPLEK